MINVFVSFRRELSARIDMDAQTRWVTHWRGLCISGHPEVSSACAESAMRASQRACDISKAS